MSSNPFKIEGPACVGVSGGESSAKMVYEILQAWDGKVPQDVVFLFENTGEEDERSLYFNHRIETAWAFDLKWLEYYDVFEESKYSAKSNRRLDHGKRDYKLDPGFKIVDFETASRAGEPFDLMIEYYSEYRRVLKEAEPELPNPAQRLCTFNLKFKVMQNYMRSLGYKRWDIYAGIRADEPKRLRKMAERNESGKDAWETFAPLAEAGITKGDVITFWERQSFKSNVPPHAGNCTLCWMKSEAKLYQLLRQEENRGPVAQRWIDRENRTGKRFRQDRPDYQGLLDLAPLMCEVCNTAKALEGSAICFACGTEQLTMFDQSTDDLVDCICGE